MNRYPKGARALAAAALVASGVCVSAQNPPQTNVPASPRLPLAPLGRVGNAITPAQEGWWRNEDGTVTFLIGYYNRNETTIEIPIGSDNRIEPGGPDMGQPTVFLPRRQYGMFTITVPKDFGTKRLTWTLVANGHASSITLWINQPYVVDPFRNAATGNTPPRVKLHPDGPELVAGPRGIAATYQSTVNTPLPLSVWVKDAGDTLHIEEPIALNRVTTPRVTWAKYRGPGPVKFDPATVTLPQNEGTASATATFSVPGEYRLRAQINDASGEGGGGDQCCWTSAHVTVQVR